MNEKLVIDIRLEVLYDKEEDEYTILSSTQKISGRFPVDSDEWTEKTLSSSEIRYGYIGFNSKKGNIAHLIIPGQPIKLRWIKKSSIKELDLKVHNSARRIDKLTKFYNEENIVEGQKVLIRLLKDKNILEIKLI